jgi:hypothetical protein
MARPREPAYNSDSTTKDVKFAYKAMEWSIGGLILCAGKVLDNEEEFAHLWGPSNQVYSPYFKRQSNDWGMWAATINSSHDLFQGAILIRSVDHALENFEWNLRVDTLRLGPENNCSSSRGI